MKPNDEVVYTIAISGIKGLVAQGNMAITPATKTAPGMISIPRLCTQWRGDDEEKSWQENVMRVVKEQGASIAIDVQPWSHAPGYPQGDTEL